MSASIPTYHELMGELGEQLQERGGLGLMLLDLSSLAAIELEYGSAAFAEVRAGAFTLSPMVGYHLFDGALNLEDSEAFGLILGYNFTKNWALEFDARFMPTTADERHGQDVDTLI